MNLLLLSFSFKKVLLQSQAKIKCIKVQAVWCSMEFISKSQLFIKCSYRNVLMTCIQGTKTWLENRYTYIILCIQVCKGLWITAMCAARIIEALLHVKFARSKAKINQRSNPNCPLSTVIKMFEFFPTSRWYFRESILLASINSNYFLYSVMSRHLF